MALVFPEHGSFDHPASQQLDHLSISRFVQRPTFASGARQSPDLSDRLLPEVKNLEECVKAEKAVTGIGVGLFSAIDIRLDSLA